MTPREFEQYALGVADYRGWVRKTLAWVQVNLMNIHVPKGKSGFTVEKLAPDPKPQAESEEMDDLEVEAFKQSIDKMREGAPTAEDRISMMEARARLQRRQLEEEELKESDKAFWEGDAGRRLEQQMWAFDLGEYLEGNGD